MLLGSLSEYIYNFDRVVVGAGLNASLHAYYNDSILVDCGENTPFEHDYLKLTSGESLNKKRLRDDLRFQMSLAGKLPFSDKVESIRIVGESLRIITKDYKVLKANFNELTIFDDTSIRGLDPPTERVSSSYVVLDWFDVRSGMRHEKERLYDNSNFVSEICFYPSERIGTKKDDKDLVAVSHLTREQMKDIEYSDLYVKFKVLDAMKAAGILGAKNGVALPRCPLKIELSRREVKKYFIDFYEDYDNIKFIRKTDQELFEAFRKSPNAYINKINEYTE